MRLKHYPVEKLKQEILQIVGRYLSLEEYRLFFFGSRVNGKGDERSDIDVGIEGKNEVPIEIMGSIKEELEKLPTLYKIELVDFKKAPPNFRKVALQAIEPFVKKS
ncbi:MAG: nucleotidyltransferase domain-containing protein [Candidatus Omnitrophica bacterium]|nr:nucleotidyltransferase domain-containing protein [Candidatus Omnitrophota bacterium]